MSINFIKGKSIEVNDIFMVSVVWGSMNTYISVYSVSKTGVPWTTDQLVGFCQRSK